MTRMLWRSSTVTFTQHDRDRITLASHSEQRHHSWHTGQSWDRRYDPSGTPALSWVSPSPTHSLLMSNDRHVSHGPLSTETSNSSQRTLRKCTQVHGQGLRQSISSSDVDPITRCVCLWEPCSISWLSWCESETKDAGNDLEGEGLAFSSCHHKALQERGLNNGTVLCLSSRAKGLGEHGVTGLAVAVVPSFLTYYFL